MIIMIIIGLSLFISVPVVGWLVGKAKFIFIKKVFIVQFNVNQIYFDGFKNKNVWHSPMMMEVVEV